MEDQQGLRKIMHHEEAGLRRVYTRLADYAGRKKRFEMSASNSGGDPNEIQILDSPNNNNETKEQDRSLIVHPNNHNTSLVSSSNTSFQVGSPKKLEAKIGALDLAEVLKDLGKRASKRYIWDMIWEVDENLDGCIDWEELKLCFQRNISDKTGLEPSKFFNVVQFLIFDTNENGKVSVDETLAFLHARYGRRGLESKLQELFGGSPDEGTEGGEIDFLQYLEAMNIAQMEMYKNSELGQVQMQKSGQLPRT